MEALPVEVQPPRLDEHEDQQRQPHGELWEEIVIRNSKGEVNSVQ